MEMPEKKTYMVVRPDREHPIEFYPTKTIIAGFPGVGKSTAAKNSPMTYVDMESSNYHWIIDGEGNKACNPEWPKNYIDAILEVASRRYDENNTQIYILISTHAEVLKELELRRIYYNAVIPKSKDLYIQRYKDRGNDEAFINLLNNKFEDFIKDVENSGAFCIYYTDGYLANIFARCNEES